jgi:hypothetical protein
MNHTVTGWSLGGDECLEMVKTYTIIHTVYFNLKKVSSIFLINKTAIMRYQNFWYD